MRRYRILLVDDEAEVRESIAGRIDWDTIGLEVSGEAENGEDALEKIELLEPDIVLTDIRMPYMDGLTLSERIHQLYPSIRTVIFSGYDEFEYAKQAIRINVTEYILKPVNADELTEILVRIRQGLDEEYRKRSSVDALREHFNRNLPILREHFLSDLAHDRIDASRIHGMMREYRLNLVDAKQWVIVQTVTDRPSDPQTEPLPGLHREDSLIPLSVRQTLENRIGRYTSCAGFRSSVGICFLVAFDKETGLDGLISVLRDACRECKRMLGLDVTAGVGRVCDSLADASRSYRESREAVGYRAVYGAGSVLYIADVEQSYRPIPSFESEISRTLIPAVKFGEKKEIEDAVGNIISSMKQSRFHDSQYQFFVIDFLSPLLQLVYSHELDPDQIFDAGANLAELIAALTGPDRLHSWLNKICTRIGEQLRNTRTGSVRSIAEEARRYIAEHYQDPDLSLDRICGHLHISTAYFSTGFKRETGMSFVTCLTETRLEHAVRLLRETDSKTYLIAEQVGYSDANYFSYVFKKKFGVSPTKYRQQ